MLDFINGVIANWGAYAGAAAGFVLAFDRLAKITPTDADNKIVAYAQKIFAFLGVKVADVQAGDDK